MSLAAAIKAQKNVHAHCTDMQAIRACGVGAAVSQRLSADKIREIHQKSRTGLYTIGELSIEVGVSDNTIKKYAAQDRVWRRIKTKNRIRKVTPEVSKQIRLDAESGLYTRIDLKGKYGYSASTISYHAGPAPKWRTLSHKVRPHDVETWLEQYRDGVPVEEIAEDSGFTLRTVVVHLEKALKASDVLAAP